MALSLLKPRTSLNLLQAWLDHVTIERGLSPNTIKGYRRELEKLAPAERLPHLSTADLQKRIYSAGGSSSTVNGRIAAYGSFFGFLVRFSHRKDNPAAVLARPKIHRGLPHPVFDLEAKLALLSPTYRAIAVIFSQTGMRLAEGCSVQVEIPPPEHIIVLGKGSKERRIPLTPAVQAAFTELGGEFPVGPRAIEHAFQKVGTHPHALRHHFACTLRRAGVDISVIRDLLGHENISTTTIYAGNDTSQIDQAMQVFA